MEYKFEVNNNETFIFSTKDKSIYEVKFQERVDFSIDSFRWYNPQLRLYEFLFERIVNNKIGFDREVMSTIIKIFFSYNKRNKIIYSLVANPHGNNLALTKVYAQAIINSKMRNSGVIPIKFHIETNSDSVYIFVFYHEQLGLSINLIHNLSINFFEELLLFQNNRDNLYIYSELLF